MPDPARIRLLVLDVDGTMTDGRIFLDAEGREIKVFDVRDGAGLRRWMDAGGLVALVTGRSSAAVDRRAQELGIEHVRQGVREKGPVLEAIRRACGVAAEEVAAMGDDLPDLPMLERAAYAMAPADAVPEVRAACRFVTAAPGGRGAVREAVEHLLAARG